MATYSETAVQTPTAGNAVVAVDSDRYTGSDRSATPAEGATTRVVPRIIQGADQSADPAGGAFVDIDTDPYTGRLVTDRDDLAGGAFVDVDMDPYTGAEVSDSGTPRADGVIIPTGEFRSVTVYVEDSEGKPLTEAEWVQSAGLFPTAGRVEPTPDGRMAARLWLLDAAYQEFSVLADSGQEGVGLVWYQQDTGDGPALARDEREATLRFSRVEAGGDNGLSVGYGASIGGS
jgi:hypothetical protein